LSLDQRKLAAILVADVVGYSKLVGSDEAGTLAKLAALRRELIEPTIAKHSGRLFKSVGDGFLVEFASAVQAVTAAMSIQKAGPSLTLRIGIHLGDVVVQGDDLMGDGVNIAARIEGVAEPGGIAISRAVHEQVRDKLNAGFIDKGEVELKNITRPVRVFTVGSGGAPERAPALALPDKPSIAVLPFQNMSGDPDQEYFADGMVEDIITALSRFKSLFVIARNSSFTYKGRAVDIKKVGQELGVRYVLEGSVRKAGGQVRITGQLIDSETGAHLWADRFDGSVEDVFELQDRVTASVAAQIAPAMDWAEIDRAKRKVARNFDAYDVFLRGMEKRREGIRDTKDWDEALRLFYRAIELDPGFATAYAMAAFCYQLLRIRRGVVDGEREESEVRRLSLRAAALGEDDAVALCFAAYPLMMVCRDYEAGMLLAERALSLNPNLADGWSIYGNISVWNGQHEKGIAQLEHALRLNPKDQRTFATERALVTANICLRRFDEALKWAKQSFARTPEDPLSMRTLASAYARAGQLDEARRLMSRALQKAPEMTLGAVQRLIALRRPEDREQYLEGARLAGLPE